jgi:hypothetical protein
MLFIGAIKSTAELPKAARKSKARFFLMSVLDHKCKSELFYF